MHGGVTTGVVSRKSCSVFPKLSSIWNLELKVFSVSHIFVKLEIVFLQN